MSDRWQDPLHDDVIDRLFSVLALRYGSPFLDRWRDLDIGVVKADWARELSGFSSNLGALRFALDHLPEKPPTVMDFRKLANAAPAADPGRELGFGRGEVRGPTPAEREALRALAADIRRGQFFAKPSRQWAHDLLACHAAGWRNGKPWSSTPAALAMAREAIGVAGAPAPPPPSPATQFLADAEEDF
jgi:hypothetical protein